MSLKLFSSVNEIVVNLPRADKYTPDLIDILQYLGVLVLSQLGES
jgi:hypothetical protein